MPNAYTLKCSGPYWSNPPFLIFWHPGTLALSTERQSARMSKNKNGGLDQYGPERFCRFIFATIRKNVEMKGLNGYEWLNAVAVLLLAVEVALDPTEVGLVGERGPDDKQPFLVAFFRKSSSTTTTPTAGQSTVRRQRRSADPGRTSTNNGQQSSSRRHRYRAADRPATAWSYHGLLTI